MDLTLSAEYEAFRRDIAALLEANRDKAPTQDDVGMKNPKRLAWQKWLIENGLAARTIPKEYGGYGAEADLLKSRIISEEFARTGIPRGLTNQGVSMLVPTLLELGTDAQKDAYIRPTLMGDMIWCQGYSEPGSGSDLASLSTKAHIDGDDYVINGQKIWTSTARQADMIFCLVRTEPDAKKHEGISYLLFSMDTPGIEVRPLVDMTMSANFNEVFFNDVRVPASNLLGGEEGKGFIQLMQKLPQERHIIGLQGVGMIERALHETINYVKDRKAFGQTIMDFQNTQFKLAELDTELTAATVFLDRYLELHIEGRFDAIAAAKAKLLTTELQGKVMDECLQLHGGYGYMWEYPVARAWADARVQRIYAGTNEVMKLIIGRELLK